MLTVDMYEGRTVDIRLTGTAIDIIQVTGMNCHRGLTTCLTDVTSTIDVSAYFYLRLSRRGGKQQYCTDDGLFIFKALCLPFSLLYVNQIIQILIRQLVEIGGVDIQVEGQ